MVYSAMAKKHRGVVDITSIEYPARLKAIKDAPPKLYYKGKWDSRIFENCLAVVGSRRMSAYGKQITARLVGEIASSGVTIVSGFMYGIDCQAHRAALACQAKTIAVMPCGADVIHPAHQVQEYEGILKTGGLVISELEWGSQAKLWTFVRRNRIIAALSQSLMVVEAGEKSGTLVTAQFAKAYGRKIFAVPGPLTSALSRGVMRLIREGAEVVTGAGDVLAYYGMRAGVRRPGRKTGLSGLDRKIISNLEREDLDLDDLSRLTGVFAPELGAALSLLEIKGAIEEVGGKYSIKNN